MPKTKIKKREPNNTHTSTKLWHIYHAKDVNCPDNLFWTVSCCHHLRLNVQSPQTWASIAGPGHVDVIRATYFRGGVRPPPINFSGEVDTGRGSPQKEIKIFWIRPKTSAHPVRLRENHCLSIFKGHLSTNPILSALNLQGSKSNIYVYTSIE